MNRLSSIWLACLLFVTGMQAGAQVNDWISANWSSSPYVQDIAIDGAGRVFAATDGVYRSTDNGDSWQQLPFPDTDVSCIGINGSAHVFVGTWGHGLYRSTDNGDSWVKAGLQTSRINCIAINTAGSIFVGLDAMGGDSTFYRSTDNGNSWILRTIGMPSPSQIITAIATGGTGLVYASPTPPSGEAVFRSTDDGDSWTPTGSGSIFNLLSLLVTPSGHVFAGGYGLHRTTDDGVRWASVDSGCTTDLVRSLITNSPGYIFRGMASYGPEGGVYVSRDDGLHWTERTSGLPMRVIQKLAMNSEGVIFAATYGAGVFRTSHSMTAVSEPAQVAPDAVRLYQNYPNPFNPSTSIRYGLPNRSHVTLSVYNTLGQRVSVLENGEVEAGYHDIKFDGSGLSSGIYFYRIEIRPLDSAVGQALPDGRGESKIGAGSFVEVRKLILLR